MIIKITNGEVHIKDICTRKTKKEYNQALYQDLKTETTDEGKVKFNDFTLSSVDKANDVALVSMTDKIIIDGEEKPVNINTFDEMASSDVDKVIIEVSKVMNKEIPKV